MLTATNLSLSYGKNILVHDVALTLMPGTITGLVAPNGYGKTTLLRALAGIDGARARGTLDVDGIGPRNGSALRRLVFYAPGNATLLYPNLTVRDHLRMAARLWASPLDPDVVARRTGIDVIARKRVRALSQGMKQQLTLAIAYLTGSRYLLLDEPMNALDPTNVQLHSQILRNLARHGTAVVMSSHILENVDAIADRILFIKDRGLIEHDPSRGSARALELYNRLYRD